MEHDVVIVIDCGSTNITMSAVDIHGTIVKSASTSNTPSRQSDVNESYFIWDMDEIWEKICRVSGELCSGMETERIKAVTITTFGADGTFLDKENAMVYPVISWQCTRTEESAHEIADMIDPREIYNITGYNIIRFNTLLRFLWLRKHAPEVFDRADKWLMTPGLISCRLSGECSIDSTSASTTMAIDMKERKWSEKMLGFAGMDASFFPQWVEPGETIGTVTSQASSETGLPEGIPVIATGHDTQFALIGSGAGEDEAVLSSGTWEILLVRTKEFEPNDAGYENGLIFECDSIPGIWNPQLLMMGSGVLEWVRKQFFAVDASNKDIYNIMISEAENIRPDSSTVFFSPNFVPGTGPLKKYNTPGGINGLTVTTTRGEIYHAALEGLSFQLKSALEVVKSSTGFSPKGLCVVGGGAKNMLWNRIRADVTGLPVTITSQTEITALGAALFAFKGVGIFDSIDEAKEHIDFDEKVIQPSELKDVYDDKYHQFMRIPQALQAAYKEK